MLPQKNRRYADSCDRFLKEYSSLCRISSSVKKTAFDLLRRAYKYVSEELQESLLPYMKKKRINQITCGDCLIFEDFFYAQRREMTEEGKTEIYYELIGQIEQWIAEKVHEIPRGKKLENIDFLAEILAELSVKSDDLKTQIEIIEAEVILESPDLNAQVLSIGVKKVEDIVNLASAIRYQFENNTWVIFVTFDEKDVLSYRPMLKEICALHSSKPAYAHDYLVELSKLPRPVNFYKKISSYSVQQKAFANAVKKGLQITIM